MKKKSSLVNITKGKAMKSPSGRRIYFTPFGPLSRHIVEQRYHQQLDKMAFFTSSLTFEFSLPIFPC